MVIVDTTVWIDYLRGIENAQTRWLDLSLDSQRLGLTNLILCEVFAGHFKSRNIRPSSRRSPKVSCV